MRRACIALGTCALLTACGGASAPDRGQGPAPIGKIVQLKADVVRVGGEEVEQRGHRLFPKSVITSDSDGGAIFEIDGKVKACDFDEDVDLEVMPSEEVLVRVRQGSTTCMTEPSKAGGNRQTFEVGGDPVVSVEFLDPIFSVALGEEGAIVRSRFGFVQVSKPGSQPVLLGPESESMVIRDQSAISAEPLDPERLHASDRDVLTRMVESLPPPDYSPPDPGDSPQLQRISTARQIRIALDNRRSEPVGRFVTSFAEFLAGRWGDSRLRIAEIAPDEAPSALQAGRHDLFVSPGPIAGTESLALFSDESGVEWSMWARPDDSFQTALTSFLKTSSDHGEYGIRYLQAFGRVPTYEAVRSLVFPTDTEVERGADPWSSAREMLQTGQPILPTPVTPSPTSSPPTNGQDGELRVLSVALRAQPSIYLGPCPTTISFHGQIFSEGGRGQIQFRSREDGRTTGTQTVMAEEDGSRDVTVTRTIKSSGSGSHTLEVTSPNFVASNAAQFQVTCEEIIDSVVGQLKSTLDQIARSVLDLVGGLLERRGLPG